MHGDCFSKRNSSKESGDSRNKNQIGCSNYVAFNPGIAAFRESEAKRSQDRPQKSDVGSSSDLSKNVEIPANFEHIGGNTKLAKAQIILLGEAHIPQHHKDIVDFINAYAKDGDIVLVEGVQAGQELDKDQYADMEQRRRGGEPRSFTNDVKIYGWDDIESQHEEVEIRQMLNKIDKLKVKGEDLSRKQAIQSRLQVQYQEIFPKTLEKRNETMLETINNKRNGFSNKRLFIIAGENHFTESRVQEKLKGQLYIVLRANYKPTEEDLKDFIRRQQ